MKNIHRPSTIAHRIPERLKITSAWYKLHRAQRILDPRWCPIAECRKVKKVRTADLLPRVLSAYLTAQWCNFRDGRGQNFRRALGRKSGVRNQEDDEFAEIRGLV